MSTDPAFDRFRSSDPAAHFGPVDPAAGWSAVAARLDEPHRAGRTAPWAAMAGIAVVASFAALAVTGANPSAPPPLQLAGQPHTDGPMPAVGDLAAAGREMVAGWAAPRFVVADGLTAPTGDATVWRLDSGDGRQAAAELAARFGVDGPTTELGSAAAMTVTVGGWPDATVTVTGDGTWWYSAGEAATAAWCVPGEPADGTGRVAVSEPDPQVDPDPAGVPTTDGDSGPFGELAPVVDGCEAPSGEVYPAAAAEAEAARLWGELPDGVVLAPEPTSADVWGTAVFAVVTLDGTRTELVYSASFAPDGAVVWASGHTGVFTEVGRYPRIGTAEAVDRLAGQFGNGTVGVSEPAVAATEAPATGASGSGDGTGGAAAAVPSDPCTDTVAPPVAADDLAPAPDPVDVTLIAVDEVLLTWWEVGDTMVLIPGYEFTDDTGAPWRVIAIPDEYLTTPDNTLTAPAGTPDSRTSDPDATTASSDGDSTYPSPGDVEPATPGTDCGPAPTDPAPNDPVTPTDPVTLPDPTDPAVLDPAPAERLAAAAVGLPADEVEQRGAAVGITVRVVSLDGEPMMVTMDYRVDRVNISVVDGAVTDAVVG